MSEIAAGAIGLTGGSEYDETHLIRRCREQDTEAFRWLILRYQSRIYNFVRRMVSDIDDAEDVTQEVFVKAFRNIRHYDGRAALVTWLFKIAANLCVDRARRRKRRGDAVSLDERLASATLVPADPRWNPEGLAVASEMRAALDAASHSAPPPARATPFRGRSRCPCPSTVGTDPGCTWLGPCHPSRPHQHTRM